MQYELGKQYEMRVVEMRKDSNDTDYIVLHDDDSLKEYRVYNILKCQYNGLPDTLYVKVKSIDEFGRIKFVQDEERLVKEHYEIGKLYAFEIVDVKEDYKTNAPYYVIEDNFKDHHYYFRGDQKYQIGDDCILEVEGFTDKGFLKLKEVVHIDSKQNESVCINSVETSNTNKETGHALSAEWANLPSLQGVAENETTELKRSIVFPAGGVGPDIDKQITIILKELTAFLNTQGGTLYIGVHDATKKVIGIENDYQHLNEGEEDQYAGQYSPSIDGYELKIRNMMDKYCPSVANSLISFEFPKLGNREYCKITVKAANRPIFLKGTWLYIRQGNRIKQLKGDEITHFVYDRMTVSIKNVLDVDDIVLNAGAFDIETLKHIMRGLLNERHATTIAPPPPPTKDIDYWIIWNDDSTWYRQREKSEDVSVLQIPVYKGMSDPLVVFCYENNRINTVKLTDLRKGVNLGVVQKNGWCDQNGKPKNVFVAEPSSLVVIHSIDYNSIEYVKLHTLTDFTPTKTAKSAGAVILPDGVSTISYSIVGSEHRNQVSHLIGTKAGRTKEKGEPLSSVAYANEIDYLKKV